MSWFSPVCFMKTPLRGVNKQQSNDVYSPLLVFERTGMTAMCRKRDGLCLHSGVI